MKSQIFTITESLDQSNTQIGKYFNELNSYTSSKLQIPSGIVIPSTTIWQFFSEIKISDIWTEKLELLDPENVDVESLSLLSVPIVAAIKNSKFSENLTHELAKGYSNISKFTESFVNIKLFSNNKTVNLLKNIEVQNIKGNENIMTTIKQLLSLIFEPEVLFQLYQHQQSPFTIDLEILLQKSIQAEVTGVVYNVSPIDHDDDKVYIEAILGQVEPLLNHELIPDTFIFSKSEKKMIDSYISKQEWMQIRGTSKENSSANMKIPVSKTWQEKPKLDQKKATQLFNIVSEISVEAPSNTFQIVWALENEKFWIYTAQDLFKVERKYRESALPNISSTIDIGEIDESELDVLEPVEINYQEPEVVEPLKNIHFREEELLEKERAEKELRRKSEEIEMNRKKEVERLRKIAEAEEEQRREQERVNHSLRKGIIIKNNKVIEDGEGQVLYTYPAPISEDQKKAKEILYGSKKNEKKEEVVDNQQFEIALQKIKANQIFGILPMLQNRSSSLAKRTNQSPVPRIKTVGGATKLQEVNIVKTITKIYLNVENIQETSLEEISYCDGAQVFEEFNSSNTSTSEEVNKLAQLLSPRELLFRISLHPEIRYSASNIGSINEDLNMIKMVRNKHSSRNIHIVIPFIRTADELNIIRAYIDDYGLKQSNFLKLYISIDNIFAANNIESLLNTQIDGMIIDVEEIIRIAVGVTKDKYLAQRNTILMEYKLSETGILKLINDISVKANRDKVPMIINLSEFSPENIKEMVTETMKNKIHGILIDNKNLKVSRSIIRSIEEAAIGK